MALCRKNITITRTNCGANVFGLAGFLRDDDLISHDDPLGRRYLTAQLTKEHIENIIRRSGQAVSQAMAEITNYVALPFVAADDGFAAGELTECFNPNVATTAM